ncbi:type VI secretion system membrane subunit TssM [Duganella sp. LX20W]|uniref:Type VI secretion system membrane subunit TssM n=1 Tax=Rugamonas brunnea TaxID=2758569 RepID=A0A7W2EVS5_9BURK|nr:type VI secretion system membrane subunit TssM [Rugamonas brunnea]MBA5639496.1 type VI secretion system membrane subunit TssM [Rugamonas brunnea]
MRNIWYFLLDSRKLALVGFIGLLAFLYLGSAALELTLLWTAAALATALVVWAIWYGWRWHRARRASSAMAQVITGDSEAGKAAVPATTEGADAAATRAEVSAIRDSMLKAIATIKGSKMGMVSGARALYELPWYMIIGNPAAGKSSAIAHSGLQFPFADSKIVQGVAGTRNCDWFFTTDGILLDTAGRYAVVDEHRAEWFGFLDLLKKYRKRAPINGIIIAVSIAELRGDDPEAGIKLARSLRQRVQDLIERLEVFAPVYVVFTKADLIAGFGEFFAQTERSERERVWGATMPYKRKTTSQQLLAFFDQGFSELCDGVKEMSLANMAMQRRERMPSGVFTFPLEFATIRASLRAFLATLFEENPFQFKPVFRGFYFTSALQEGQPVSAQWGRTAERFGLQLPELPMSNHSGQTGYFLLNLFRKVIFADKDLVAQYASKSKVQLKYAVFFTSVIVLGASLGGWSWSYLGNRQLVSNVQADLDKVVKLQDQRLDLQSRLEALDILQDRIEQLDSYRRRRPWSLRMGLYQGELLERKLREEYFSGVKEVMLKPVAANLEALLAEMNAHADQLQPVARVAPEDHDGTSGVPAVGAASALAASTAGQVAATAVSSATTPATAPTTAPVPRATAAQPYLDASPTNVEDAYNALKTYLMLVDKTHAEPSHLNDQLTRYWRGWLESNRGAMPREQMIRSAERLMTFYLAQIADPSWPRVEEKLALVDQARENLRHVVHGMPARERVYADIRARAATRFPATTVARIVGEQDQALVAGSHAVSGAFTREAWEKYVDGAFKEAATHELQSADWVLQTAAKDDLTLEGSPEQIQKGLVDLYKADYAREWKKFVQGVTISDLRGFDAAVVAMNRLGDPQSSPLAKLLTTIYQQTTWDNPAASRPGMQEARRGMFDWISNAFSRNAPVPVSGVNLAIDPARFERQMGPVGREFAGVAKLVAPKEKDASLMGAYLDALSRVRTRLNQLKNQGDPGPGARQLMQQTLEGSGSELSDALRLVDEQMLTGMSDSQKQAIRPILVRPLMQTFAVIIGPSQTEINKTWLAQVYDPFQKSLANKYPFSTTSRIEASNAEIVQFFGPDGVIAKFVTGAMGPLVVRRGDVLAPRTWADMGISLAPQVVARFPGWIAPIGAGGVATSSAAAQTVFQIQPMPAPGTLEYTVEIDGQQLRYRNTPAQWSNMVHPSPQGAPGARITAVAFDGRSVDIFNEPGQFGLKRMIDAASKQRKDGGVYELRWTSGAITVALDLKITSSPESSGRDGGAPEEQGFRGMSLPETIVGAAP